MLRNKLTAQIKAHPVLVFALGGIVSGLLSYLVIKFELPPRFTILLEAAKGTSIVPGLLFGLLIAACNARFGLRNALALASIVVLTAIAWILAFDCTMKTHSFLQSYIGSILVEPQAPAENAPLILAFAGMVGGLVGGLGTVFGVALVNARFRSIRNFVTIVASATVLGCLVELMRWDHVDLAVIFLFVGWQVPVSALIARALLADGQTG